MIKSSRHILKFSNTNKLKLLEETYTVYRIDLIYFVNLLWNDELKLDKFLSSKDIPFNLIKHSNWKATIYKHASEIVRGQLESNKKLKYDKFKKVYSYFSKQNRQLTFLSKRFSELNINYKKYKPTINNVSINIDGNLFNVKRGCFFNEFVLIRLPFLEKRKVRSFATTIKLPIKHHKYSLKYSSWDRKNVIKLIKKNDNFFIELVYEKENVVTKPKGESLGIDIGYNKLIVTSRNEKLGLEINDLYKRITNKQYGSKNYKDLLIHRNNLINKTINDLDLSSINKLIIEDLKSLPRKGKLSRWVYKPIIKKIESKSIEQGVELVKVSPVNTSITCSKCGFVHKNNRQKELFKCIECRYEDDADYNASLNILHRGESYNPSNTKNLITIKIN